MSQAFKCHRVLPCLAKSDAVGLRKENTDAIFVFKDVFPTVSRFEHMRVVTRRELSESELARACAGGDRNAQAQLYSQYASGLYRLCLRYMGDAEEARDIMHDSMIRVFDGIAKFRYAGSGSLGAWISRIGVNAAVDSLRRQQKIQRIPLDRTFEDHFPEPDAGDVEMIPANVLQQMIASLPVERRTVFNMYCIDGFSHKDIAKALNISEKGSASVLAKARAGLKKAISDYLKGTR